MIKVVAKVYKKSIKLELIYLEANAIMLFFTADFDGVQK